MRDGQRSLGAAHVVYLFFLRGAVIRAQFSMKPFCLSASGFCSRVGGCFGRRCRRRLHTTHMFQTHHAESHGRRRSLDQPKQLRIDH